MTGSIHDYWPPSNLFEISKIKYANVKKLYFHNFHIEIFYVQSVQVDKKARGDNAHCVGIDCFSLI